MNTAIKNMFADDFNSNFLPSRLKIWDIESCFKCPVVGGCLDIDEQKKLLKKAGIKPESDRLFDIHEILVASLDSENDLSRKIDEILSRKFQKNLDEFSMLSEKEMIAEWRTIKNSSNVHGAFFAAATRPDLSFNARKEIFGDIHMSMHTCAADVVNIRAVFERQKLKVDELEKSLKNETASRKAVIKEKNLLETESIKFKKLLETVESEKENLTRKLRCLVAEKQENHLEAENSGLKANLRLLEKKLAESEAYVLQLLSENRKLDIEAKKQKACSERICSETSMIVEHMAEVSGCSESCPYYNLCSKKVLIIGGLTRMETLYREMIETNGGIFDYHNGDMRNGSKDLEKSVRRADMILCPVDCNSHGACILVKKFCKKHGKQFHMLPSSGVSSVFKAVFNENAVMN